MSYELPPPQTVVAPESSASTPMGTQKLPTQRRSGLSSDLLLAGFSGGVGLAAAIGMNWSITGRATVAACGMLPGILFALRPWLQKAAPAGARLMDALLARGHSLDARRRVLWILLAIILASGVLLFTRPDSTGWALLVLGLSATALLGYLGWQCSAQGSFQQRALLSVSAFLLGVDGNYVANTTDRTVLRDAVEDRLGELVAAVRGVETKVHDVERRVTGVGEQVSGVDEKLRLLTEQYEKLKERLIAASTPRTTSERDTTSLSPQLQAAAEELLKSDDPIARAAAAVASARSSRSRGDVEAADRELETVGVLAHDGKLNPDQELEFQRLRGNHSYSLRRIPEAIAAYRSCIKLRPTEYDAHLALALALSEPDQRGVPTSLAEADQVLRSLLAELPTNHPLRFRALRGRSEIMQLQGNTAAAEPLLREAWRYAKQSLGPDDPETLDAQCYLSTLLRRSGRINESLELAKDAFERGRSVLGPDDGDTWSFLSIYAGALADSGRLQNALLAYADALEGLRRTRDETDPTYLATLVNYAWVRRNTGDDDGSETLLREGVAGLRGRLGPNDPTTLAAQANLAASLEGVGRYEEAETLLRETLDAQRVALGAEHSQTLATLANYGIVLHRLGRIGEAESALQHALQSMRRTADEEGPDALAVRAALAEFYEEGGRYVHAEEQWRLVWQGRKRVFGPGHRLTLVAHKRLCDCFGAPEDLALAERCYSDVLAALPESTEPMPDLARNVRCELAWVYSQTQRRPQALELVQQVLDELEKMEPIAPRTEIFEARDEALLAKAGLHEQAGEVDSAVRLLEQRARHVEEAFGKDAPRSYVARSRVGRVLLRAERYAEAEPVFRAEMEVRRRDKPSDWQWAAAAADWGRCLAGVGRFQPAEDALLEAHSVLRAADPPARPNAIAETMDHIIFLYQKWHEQKRDPKLLELMNDWRGRREDFIRDMNLTPSSMPAEDGGRPFANPDRRDGKQPA